uniref:Uncharacterized protein n=1 Tax=Salix viminalis TaxID=40686 RepID=A0A6N2LWS3_SALVM
MSPSRPPWFATINRPFGCLYCKHTLLSLSLSLYKSLGTVCFLLCLTFSPPKSLV